MLFIFIGSFDLSVPPAARALIVLSAVYAILAAAKQNDWIAANMKGWWAVIFNIILTTLGMIIVIPAANLYSLNTVVTVVVGVLGSSGLHGMVKSIPPTVPPATDQPYIAPVRK